MINEANIKIEEAIGTFQYAKMSPTKNSDYCINIIETESPDGLPVSIINKGKNKHGKYEFTVRGYNLPSIGTLKVRYRGQWETSRYGLQMKVVSFDYILPDTDKGIINYLMSKRFVGIGKSRAKLIVNEFHEKTFDVLRDTPERLLTIRGLTTTIVQNAHDRLLESEAFNRLSVFLGAYGVTSDKISLVYRKWGNNAEKVLRNNPFKITEIPGCGFALADQIARGMNIMLDSNARIESAIVYTLVQDSLQKGNIYTTANVLYTNAMKLLNEGLDEPAVTKERFMESFNTAKAEGLIVSRGGNRFIYTEKNEKAEFQTSRDLMSLLSNKIPKMIQRAYIDAVEEYRKLPEGKMLSDRQVEAVKNAITHRVAIITGGPGTGKTTIVKCLIWAYKKVEGEKATVTMIAPTGKAANRMSESTGLPAATIHSKIHLYGDDMDAEQCVALPEGLIVVDEFSMVDMNVMEKMMASIKSKKSHLVMCGDVDQLPSVGPGAVLDQMIQSGVIPTSRLTEIFRQKGGPGLIVENAYKVNNGDTNLTYGEGFSMINANSEDEALDLILKTYSSEVAKWGVENVALLCPMRNRKYTVSVENINKILQDVCNPRRDGEITASVNGTEFRIRDRVIQLKNTVDASNGDIGVITDIEVQRSETGESEAIFHIDFERGNHVEYNREKIANVTLAYALTIHKSQGSEYKSVIIPCISSQRGPLFRRNLLYTAITRTKAVCTIVGDTNAVNYMIEHTDNGKRQTLLYLRLQNLATEIGTTKN